MPSPVIIFDHIHNVAVVTGTDPRADQKLAETLECERQTVSAGGSQPPSRQD